MPDQTPQPLTRKPAPFSDRELTEYANGTVTASNPYAAVQDLATELIDARGWARHGYEIGQRSCTWSDHGVAPAWLTEGHAPESLEPTEDQRRLFGLDEENAKLRVRIAELKLRLEPANSPSFEALMRELGIDMTDPQQVLAEKVVQQRDRIAELEDQCRQWDAAFQRQKAAHRERRAELRARIWELEAAQAVPALTPEPHAYIAVKRHHSPNATEPEWEYGAYVLSAGEYHGADRALFADRGFDLLPIVGTETGTRPATPQSDPAGYVVVTRNSEGGVHRSATVWDSLDQARAAEGVQAGYADGTGCTAAVYALQEVQQ